MQPKFDSKWNLQLQRGCSRLSNSQIALSMPGRAHSSAQFTLLTVHCKYGSSNTFFFTIPPLYLLQAIPSYTKERRLKECAGEHSLVNLVIVLQFVCWPLNSDTTSNHLCSHICRFHFTHIIGALPMVACEQRLFPRDKSYLCGNTISVWVAHQYPSSRLNKDITFMCSSSRMNQIYHVTRIFRIS